MSVLTTYTAFRTAFATAAVPVNDGLDQWPYVQLLVPGFTNTWTIPNTLPSGFATGTPWVITINAGANDAVAGVDEYTWYLSQRTDDPLKQYFTIAHPNVLPATRSGTVNIYFSAFGQSVYGFVDTTVIPIIFRNVDLYVQRISDDAIQHRLLIEPLLGD